MKNSMVTTVFSPAPQVLVVVKARRQNSSIMVRMSGISDGTNTENVEEEKAIQEIVASTTKLT